MREIRTYFDVGEEGDSNLPDQVAAHRERVERRLARVRRVAAIASGKGGVGKSAVTANLAVALARRGHRVGAVDADLNGPSLARMLGTRDGRLVDEAEGVVPPSGVAGVRVVSMELLQGEDDAPLSWKGPGTDRHLWQSAQETGTLREFLSDVAWGELDFLLVDVPPGTDKILRLLELLPRLDIALLVTTPSEMSRFVVSKSVRMMKSAEPGALGLVANMTDFVCPDCGHRAPLFPGSGEDTLSSAKGLDLWARIPFDPVLGSETDRGRPPTGRNGGSAASALAALADRVEEELAP